VQRRQMSARIAALEAEVAAKAAGARARACVLVCLYGTAWQAGSVRACVCVCVCVCLCLCVCVYL
jgi:hypothetical protein